MRATNELETYAAFLSAVAVTERAMHAGQQQHMSFSGSNVPELTQAWKAILTEGTESELWPSNVLTADQKCIDEVLRGVQHTYARFVAQKRHTSIGGSH